MNLRWTQNGRTVAGGNGNGDGFNQLSHSLGLYVDDDNQTMYIADANNHRIMEWMIGATSGRIVAGGNGQGHRNDQLNGPTNVIVDKTSNSLIICDKGNRRVVRWSRGNSTKGETIISNIACWDLMLDNNGYLYVSDVQKQEVRRWEIGNRYGQLVAGGNGQGHSFNQLNQPLYIFVDQDYSVYVSDNENQRVMKWMNRATEGIPVAGNQGQGDDLRQLSWARGIFVDRLGTLYIADRNNHRVIRCLNGSTQGSLVVGGNGEGEQANQLNRPVSLSFDQQMNLYVLEWGNHRVQKFERIFD